MPFLDSLYFFPSTQRIEQNWFKSVLIEFNGFERNPGLTSASMTFGVFFKPGPPWENHLGGNKVKTQEKTSKGWEVKEERSMTILRVWNLYFIKIHISKSPSYWLHVISAECGLIIALANFSTRKTPVLLYCIILYCIVLYCIVLHCIVLYYNV